MRRRTASRSPRHVTPPGTGQAFAVADAARAISHHEMRDVIARRTPARIARTGKTGPDARRPAPPRARLTPTRSC